MDAPLKFLHHKEQLVNVILMVEENVRLLLSDVWIKMLKSVLPQVQILSHVYKGMETVLDTLRILKAQRDQKVPWSLVCLRAHRNLGLVKEVCQEAQKFLEFLEVQNFQVCLKVQYILA